MRVETLHDIKHAGVAVRELPGCQHGVQRRNMTRQSFLRHPRRYGRELGKLKASIYLLIHIPTDAAVNSSRWLLHRSRNCSEAMPHGCDSSVRLTFTVLPAWHAAAAAADRPTLHCA
jgi:hypothetical protein